MKNREFQGSNYEAAFDYLRLKGQVKRIFLLMIDANWRTLREISDETGDGESSISAQLRNLRKPYHGSHTIMKRRRGEPSRGVWEYQLIIKPQQIKLPI